MLQALARAELPLYGMQELKFKRYLYFVSFSAVLTLVLSKSVLRPWVRENNFHEFFSIILNSIPNFLEPLVGVPAVTGILLMLRHDQARFLQRLSEKGIYVLSTLLASLYVFSQELKFHNLGGNNVYDPNDLVASGIGLLFMLVLMFRFGFIRSQATDGQGLSD